jgi:hypothetical protein
MKRKIEWYNTTYKHLSSPVSITFGCKIYPTRNGKFRPYFRWGPIGYKKAEFDSLKEAKAIATRILKSLTEKEYKYACEEPVIFNADDWIELRKKIRG